MNFKKFIAITVFAVVLAGCNSENGEVLYNENGVNVYLQQNQKLYENNNDGFTIACESEWDVKVNTDDGYLSKFILDTGNGEAWLGIKKEVLEQNQDTNALFDKYSSLMKDGIVKSANVTIGGKKGKWIKVEPMGGAGLSLLEKNAGESIQIDQSNIVTGDVNQEREDIIFISDDNFSYVFLFHADNLSIYNAYEPKIDSFLATFKFI